MKLSKSLLAAFLFAIPLAQCMPELVAAQGALEQAEAQVREPRSDGPSLPTALPRTAAGESGYLGIKADDRGPGDGMRVVEVKPGSPAEKGGLQKGDLITHVQGQAVHSVDEFAEHMSPLGPGSAVSFRVIRGDAQRMLELVLAHRVASAVKIPNLRLGQAPPGGEEKGVAVAPLGVRVEPVSKETQRSQNLTSTDGAEVTSVTRNSAADKAGIAVGAVIVDIDGVPVDSPDVAARALWGTKVGTPVRFKMYENGLVVERSVIPLARAATSVASELPRPTVEPVRSRSPAPADDRGGSMEAAHRRIRTLEEQMVELDKRLAKLQEDIEKMRGDVPKKATDD